MAEIEKLKPKPVQDRLQALAAPTQQLALPAPGTNCILMGITKDLIS